MTPDQIVDQIIADLNGRRGCGIDDLDQDIQNEIRATWIGFFEDNPPRSLVEDLYGALNFILAFYEPGQRYLDTNAWKQAEASGRLARDRAKAYLDG